MIEDMQDLDQDRMIVLSLKPRFAEAILTGDKTVELRRAEPKIVVPTRALLYATTAVLASRGFLRAGWHGARGPGAAEHARRVVAYAGRAAAFGSGSMPASLGSALQTPRPETAGPHQARPARHRLPPSPHRLPRRPELEGAGGARQQRPLAVIA